MARVKIMYWKEIPIQVQSEDDEGTKSELLDEKFQEICQAAFQRRRPALFDRGQ